MEKINNYEIIEEIKSYGKSVKLWLVEDNSGKELEILTIEKNEEFEKQIARILKNEVNPLIKVQIKGIQQILETGFDKINNVHFIVYENSQESFNSINDFNKNNFLELVETLNSLKKTNRYGFVLNTDTILVNQQNNILIKYIGLFEIFRLHKILNSEFLSPEILDKKNQNFKMMYLLLLLYFKNIY